MSITRVAKVAGVSNATVSRVINNHPRVAPKTAELVRKTMRQIGYRPSERRPGPKPRIQLPGSAGATVAFLIVCPPGYQATGLFEPLFRGISHVANEHRLNLLTSHVSLDETDLPAHLDHQKLDGVLLIGRPLSPALAARLQKIPAVWLMGNRRRPAWGDQVMPDSYAVASLAANHLAGRGHRRLAYLNLNGGHWPFLITRQIFRLVGEELDIPVDVIERRSSDPDPFNCYAPPAVSELVDRYLALPQRPTGLFVADDQQVAAIQPALIQRGVEVGPGGVEIVSCNNEQPFLVGLHPRPTEIDLRVESVGRRGVEQLIWRMAHPDVPERVIAMIEPVLVPSPAVLDHAGANGDAAVRGGA